MLNKWLLKVQVYLLSKPKFKKWTRLEDKKYDFIQAVEDSKPELPEILFSYLSTALYFPVNYHKIPWQDVFESFYKIHNRSATIRKIPITDNQSDEKSEKDPWDYSGRLWPMYLNIIASAYGWAEKMVAKLSVDDALAYLQEILTDRQLEKEFIWSTSERSIEWDKKGKGRFKPLTRPYWMQKARELPEAPPIPKSLLPMGNVVKISNDKTEKTKPKAGMGSVSASETSD